MEIGLKGEPIPHTLRKLKNYAWQVDFMSAEHDIPKMVKEVNEEKDADESAVDNPPTGTTRMDKFKANQHKKEEEHDSKGSHGQKNSSELSSKGVQGKGRGKEKTSSKAKGGKGKTKHKSKGKQGSEMWTGMSIAADEYDSWGSGKNSGKGEHRSNGRWKR